MRRVSLFLSILFPLFLCFFLFAPVVSATGTFAYTPAVSGAPNPSITGGPDSYTVRIFLDYSGFTVNEKTIEIQMRQVSYGTQSPYLPFSSEQIATADGTQRTQLTITAPPGQYYVWVAEVNPSNGTVKTKLADLPSLLVGPTTGNGDPIFSKNSYSVCDVACNPITAKLTINAENLSMAMKVQVEIGRLIGGATPIISAPITIGPNLNSFSFSVDLTGLDNNIRYSVEILNADTKAVVGSLDALVVGKDPYATTPPTPVVPTPDANGCTAGDGEYCLLQPLPQGAGNTPFGKLEYNKDTGSLDSLATVFNAYMKVIIGIIGVLAVLMVVLGGIQYMSTDAISGKESGKERITHALFGLFIALGAWILLHEINPDLVSLNLKSLSSVNTAVQEPVGDQSPEPNGTDMCPGRTLNGKKVIAGQTWPDTASEGLADSAVRKWMAEDWNKTIKVNHPTNCQKVPDSKCVAGDSRTECSCTSLTGFTQKAESMLSKINLACTTDTSKGCETMITGGTECWLHLSHGPGRSVFDLRKESVLDTYIGSKYASKNCHEGWPVSDGHSACVGNTGAKGAWEYLMKDSGSVSMRGIYIVDEGDHYHVYTK